MDFLDSYEDYMMADADNDYMEGWDFNDKIDEGEDE